MKRVLIAVLLLCLFTSCGEEKVATFSVIASSPAPTVKTVMFSVVGDIMVHDYQYNEAYDKETGEYNFMHNFQDAKKYFEGKDFVIGNLELTFGGSGRPYSSFPMFNTPDSFLDALKDAGFDLLTTANNHSMDTGMSGVIRTLDKLDEYEIDHTGTYRSAEERNNIYLREINGITFAFLSYTYGTNGIPVPESYLVNIIDENQMIDDIQKASRLADMVIIFPHLGNEYETYPREIFKNWIKKMVDAGADIVLASHPHVLQPMEYITLDRGMGAYDGFVAYSLGNFISSQTTPPRNAGIILNITVQKVGDELPTVSEVSFVPIWTQFRNAQNRNDFVVRSVYERLSLSQEEKDLQIRPQDQVRLKAIHEETASFLLGRDIPLDEIQEEYIFVKNEEESK